MSKRAKINDVMDDDFERYAALADAALTDTEIGDFRNITSHPNNAKTLRRLKNNDQSLTCLRFLWKTIYLVNDDGGYFPEARSMGWLGYFVGKSTQLETLLLDNLRHIDRDVLFAFFDGLNRNRSVRYLRISSSFAGSQALTQFFAENKNLVEVEVFPDAALCGGIAHRLSQAMRSCTSLKSFTFNYGGSIDNRYDEHVAKIIHSLSEKSQLERVNIAGCSGRRGYRALADLLNWEGSQLQSLDIEDCKMDVEDFQYFVDAVASNKKLQKLNMDGYHGRDDDGQLTHALAHAWGSMERPLLEAFSSNLVELAITSLVGFMDDEGAIAFSRALAGNRKLKVLKADWRWLTFCGWNAVSKLLCDTLSPETTYASNHTLQELGLHVEASNATAVNMMFRNQIVPLLALNRNDDKSHVASAKILKTHENFDMKVFFELEFKMLPIAVQWLARAATLVLTNLPADPNIQRRKLSVIYQFVRSAPKSFVECRLRGELEEIRAREIPQERFRQELERLEEHRRVILNRLRGD